MKDRFIGETVRLLYDLMAFSLEENIPGLMIFIDFHKAFDCLEWNFLFSFQSCFINNGLATDFFSLERGVRQGDLLCPCLFVVAVETLALAIRQNREIFGIKIGGVETNFLQYADDTTAVLSDIDSAQALLTFSKYSRTYQDL